ncbi:hypothetical protein BGZ79_003749 [Entomortierella chlamydospora]|nr:hypothetical protein BGZ79_003749 [Entomortierella chlamydospora]
MQVRQNFQQKLRQESLGDIIEESQNMMEPGSAIYGTGRNDPMVSEFGVQKALEDRQGFASQPPALWGFPHNNSRNAWKVWLESGCYERPRKLSRSATAVANTCIPLSDAAYEAAKF